MFNFDTNVTAGIRCLTMAVSSSQAFSLGTSPLQLSRVVLWQALPKNGTTPLTICIRGLISCQCNSSRNQHFNTLRMQPSSSTPKERPLEIRCHFSRHPRQQQTRSGWRRSHLGVRWLPPIFGRFLPIKPEIDTTIQPQETEFKSLALSSGCFSYVQKEKNKLWKYQRDEGIQRIETIAAFSLRFCV